MSEALFASIPHGSATDAQKHVVMQALAVLLRDPPPLSQSSSFGSTVGRRMRVVSVDVFRMPFGEDGHGREAPFVAEVECEIAVQEDMVDASGRGCEAYVGYLIDVCTVLPIVGLAGEKWISGFTQSLNLGFHAQAPIGSVLSLKSHSVAMGDQSATARCEIWDKERQVIIASGTSVKASPYQNMSMSAL